MKWIFYNPNPYGNNTGDCVIRALTLAFGKNWDDVYSMLADTPTPSINVIDGSLSIKKRT